MLADIQQDVEIEKRIAEKIREVDAFSSIIPGVVIIHRLPEFTLEYMSPLGLSLLGTTWDEVAGMSGEEYHGRFFNPEFANDSAPMILKLIQENKDDSVSFFQQVRTSRDREWDWYMCMIKILLRNNADEPVLTISVAMKIDSDNFFTAKAARLLEENRFLKHNHEKYGKLTNRERQILKLMVLGKSAVQIGQELKISTATAETHRKKIKQKLQVKNSFELGQFARAFDLF